MEDTLRSCHPAVSFGYFAVVIACSMFFMHPLCLSASLLGALLYVARLKGRRGLRRHVVWVLPAALLAAVLNPAFVHQGVTILTYLPSGNPLTLESLLYGLAAGCMLSAVVLWFVCVTEVITSDKVVYLFGRVIPALSLLLSMTLRFVPRFIRRLRTVTQAQAHMGRDVRNGSMHQRVRSALRVFSIVDVEPGERHHHRRQYALPGLRPAGADVLLPVPLRPAGRRGAGVAGVLRRVPAGRGTGGRSEVPVLPHGADRARHPADGELFRRVRAALPDACAAARMGGAGVYHSEGRLCP